MTDIVALAREIDRLWELPAEAAARAADAVAEAIGLLDRGEVRVAEKRDGRWAVNEWTKKAILLSFRLAVSEPIAATRFPSECSFSAMKPNWAGKLLWTKRTSLMPFS